MTHYDWTIDDITPCHDSLCIITGANSGIGFEAACVIAAKGAHVIFAVRDLKKGQAAIDAIITKTPKARLSLFELNLTSLASIATFCENIKKAYSKLDLLINNAGVMVPPYGKTADGFELQIGTNHFGHYALTGHLLPLLLASEHGRIVNLASSAHQIGNINFDDLNWEKRKYSPWKAYGDSKIANIYFTKEMDRLAKLHQVNLMVTSAHPGIATTDLSRSISSFSRSLIPFIGQSSAMGALPTLRAAFDPQAKGGEYFGPNGFLQFKGQPVVNKTTKRANDPKLAKRLWSVSEQLTGVVFNWKVPKPQ